MFAACVTPLLISNIHNESFHFDCEERCKKNDISESLYGFSAKKKTYRMSRKEINKIDEAIRLSNI